jgi:hypothetical protein
MNDLKITFVRRLAVRLAFASIVLCVAAAAVRFASVQPILPIAQVATILLLLAAGVLAAVDRGPRQAFCLGFVLCAVAFSCLAFSGAPYFLDTLGTGKVNRFAYRQLARQTQIDALTSSMNKPPNTAPVASGPTIQINELHRALQGFGSAITTTGPAGGPNWRAGRRGPPAVVPDGPTVGRSGRGARVASDVTMPPNPRSPGALGPAPLGPLSAVPALPPPAAPPDTPWQLPTITDFKSVAHCLWTVLFGYIGGVFARRVYDRRERTLELRPTQSG